MQAEGRGKGSRPGPPLLMIVRTLPVSHLSTLPFPAYHTPPSPQLAAVQHNPKTKTPSTQLAAAQHKQRLLSTVLQELTRTSAEAGGGSASSGPAVSDRLLAQLAARGETLCHLLSAVDSLSEALGSYTEGVACAHAACRLGAVYLYSRVWRYDLYAMKGFMLHAFRVHAVCIQGSCCMHSGFMLYAFRVHAACIQGSCCMHSGVMLYAFRGHAVCIQGSCCMHSGVMLYALG